MNKTACRVLWQKINEAKGKLSQVEAKELRTKKIKDALEADRRTRARIEFEISEGMRSPKTMDERVEAEKLKAEKRIADLNEQILSGEKRTKEPNAPIEADQELMQLREELKRVQEQFKKQFSGTKQERIAALDKSIAKLEKQLDAELVDVVKKEKAIETDPELIKLIERRDNLKQAFVDKVRQMQRDPARWMKSIDDWLKERKTVMSPEALAKIEKDLKEAHKIPDKLKRDAAVNEALKPVAVAAPWTYGDWFNHYVYGNMLSGPQSQLRNVYGNSLVGYMLRPLALAGQRDFAGLHSYLSGSWDMLVSGKAFKIAMDAYKAPPSQDYVDAGIKPGDSLLSALHQEAGPRSAAQKKLYNIMGIPGRLLQAQDKFFASQIQAGEIARLTAENGGVAPDGVRELAKNLSDKLLYREPIKAENFDSSKPWAVNALESIAGLIEKARTAESPLVRWPAQIYMRFVRTPFRMAQLGVEASPLAYLGPRMTLENIAMGRFKKSFAELPTTDQFLVREDLKNRQGMAAVGSLITAAGAAMAFAGLTTWGVPKDAEAKKRFYASGRRPYSFKVGDKWVPMMYLGPAFLAYALPAAAMDAFKDNPELANESWLNRLAIASIGVPKIILSQTPMSGVNGLLDATMGKMDRTVAGSFGFQLTQVIPGSGLIRWVNKIVDPVYRKPVTIAETIMVGVPGLSKEIAAYKDAKGLDAQRDWTDAWLPYTLGETDLMQENLYQNRQEKVAANTINRAQIAEHKAKEKKQ